MDKQRSKNIGRTCDENIENWMLNRKGSGMDNRRVVRIATPAEKME